MKYTNRQRLPAPIVQAVMEAQESHNPQADISVTGLINSPRSRVLIQRHKDAISVDIADSIWSLFGTLLHGFLSKYKNEGANVEERLFMSVSGWTLSGQPDLYWRNDCIIEDYKMTSVYAFTSGKPEWEQQLNCYGALERIANREVRGCRIRAFLRDHMESKALRDRTYPEHKCMSLDIPLWTQEKALEYITNRVKLHQDATKIEDSKLPDCLSTEMWERPECFAVTLKGASKAYRLIKKQGQEGHDEALAMAKSKGDDYYVEHRLGQRLKCEKYCLAAPFCNQYKTYKAMMSEIRGNGNEE